LSFLALEAGGPEPTGQNRKATEQTRFEIFTSAKTI